MIVMFADKKSGLGKPRKLASFSSILEVRTTSSTSGFDDRARRSSELLAAALLKPAAPRACTAVHSNIAVIQNLLI